MGRPYVGFYKKAIFPVQPFFPLISKNLHTIDSLRVFVARAIDVYLGLDLYKIQWERERKILNFGEQETKKILQQKEYKVPSKLSSVEKSVLFGGLNDLILMKKINIKDCICFYKYYLDFYSKRKQGYFMISNIHGLLVLLESTSNSSLRQLIIDELKRFNINKIGGARCFRDLLYDLDFNGHCTKELEHLLSLRILS